MNIKVINLIIRSKINAPFGFYMLKVFCIKIITFSLWTLFTCYSSISLFSCYFSITIFSLFFCYSPITLLPFSDTFSFIFHSSIKYLIIHVILVSLVGRGRLPHTRNLPVSPVIGLFVLTVVLQEPSENDVSQITSAAVKCSPMSFPLHHTQLLPAPQYSPLLFQ